MIIGPCGSGKSSLARKMAQKETDVNSVDVDYYRPGGKICISENTKVLIVEELVSHGKSVDMQFLNFCNSTEHKVRLPYHLEASVLERPRLIITTQNLPEDYLLRFKALEHFELIELQS